ncbi:hypothetical protein A9X03_07140 [Mycobacterium sp. E1715]|uniref:phosphorylase family protein n=1 Tax=Mycobacterium sp. E1715 TaxID=1856863 RepID=UPI0007FBC2C5|nr:hypothetical protein [Mycobacterium sp. E1715]OBH31694.1 hypothetical protein A9X03_07140 [Mycobacterium sp. E1715]
MALLSGRRGHARVVLMSIIDAELQAVQTLFGATEEIGVSAIYTRPEYASTGDRQYPFVLAQSSDRGNAAAALSVRNLLEWYSPEVVVVVGIGGGIQRDGRGPGLGDVVIGRYVHYADYTKNLPTGSRQRYISLDQPSARLITQHAESVAAKPKAKCFSRLDIPRPDEKTQLLPAIHLSEVIAVEAIAGNPSAEKQIEMVNRFDNADIVDMESMGVGRALHEFRCDPYPHYGPLWVPVRGVSDHVTAARPPLATHNLAGEEVVGALSDENNEQRKKWKKYASVAAACVARSLVERLLYEDRAESPADPGAPKWKPET